MGRWTETEGVGREALLDNSLAMATSNSRKLNFAVGMFASFAGGAPHVGVSRWTDGDGVFHRKRAQRRVNHLQLRAPLEEIVSGSVSFGREAA